MGVIRYFGCKFIRNMLLGKGVLRAGEGTDKVGYGSERSSIKKILIPPYPLTNFEIQMYYQNEPESIGFILEITYLMK